MPDFLDKLAQRVEAKAARLGGTFSADAGEHEVMLRDLVLANWRPLPRDIWRGARRPAIGVDSSIGRVDLANGSMLFVAQALCMGHGEAIAQRIECSRVEVEILPGVTDEGQVKRFHDLLMQSLEVQVATEGMQRLPDGGIVYIDGALYSRLPQLYPLILDGVDPLHTVIAGEYSALFDACRRHGRGLDLICLAKTSRTDLHARIWAGELDLRSAAPVADSEAIYRWTDGKAGFSTPVVLGHVSFSGGDDYVLDETGLRDAPAVAAFFVRLADYDDPLLVEFPVSCLGHTGTLSNLEAEALDMGAFDVTPILQALAADYGGMEVYNALLYSVDREVRLHRDTMKEIYTRVVGSIVGHELRLDRSDRRF